MFPFAVNALRNSMEGAGLGAVMNWGVTTGVLRFFCFETKRLSADTESIDKELIHIMASDLIFMSLCFR